VAVGLAVGACTADVAGPANYTIAVGRELDITLGTVGPGPAYDTIPQISSPAVRFLSLTEPSDLQNPGGPTQFFRFEAQMAGRAIVTFRRSGTSAIVSDIVEVQ
jgi:hypothetical protein